MAHPSGAGSRDDQRLDLDRRLRLEGVVIVTLRSTGQDGSLGFLA